MLSYPLIWGRLQPFWNETHKCYKFSCPTLSDEGVCNMVQKESMVLKSVVLPSQMRASATSLELTKSYVKPVVLPSQMRASATCMNLQTATIFTVVLPSQMRASATKSKSTYRRVGPSTWSVPITWNTIRIWYWVENFANIRKNL